MCTRRENRPTGVGASAELRRLSCDIDLLDAVEIAALARQDLHGACDPVHLVLTTGARRRRETLSDSRDDGHHGVLNSDARLRPLSGEPEGPFRKYEYRRLRSVREKNSAKSFVVPRARYRMKFSVSGNGLRSGTSNHSDGLRSITIAPCDAKNVANCSCAASEIARTVAFGLVGCAANK